MELVSGYYGGLKGTGQWLLWRTKGNWSVVTMEGQRELVSGYYGGSKGTGQWLLWRTKWNWSVVTVED